MTREEIINEIKCLLSELDNGEDAVSYLTQNDIKWLNETIKALEQKSSRDMEEIAEVINCDVDAETKCKMISNILTAKPHYFEKHEPKAEKIIKMRDATPEEKESIDKYIKSISTPTGVDFWNLEQEPCENAISRQAVLEQTYLWSKDEFLRVANPFDYLRKRINSLPPVNPQPKTGHWKVVSDGYGDNAYICECSECKDTVWVYKDADRKWNYCPNCGCRMVKQQEREE